jgi:hypothetical protein
LDRSWCHHCPSILSSEEAETRCGGLCRREAVLLDTASGYRFGMESDGCLEQVVFITYYLSHNREGAMRRYEGLFCPPTAIFPDPMPKSTPWPHRAIATPVTRGWLSWDAALFCLVEHCTIRGVSWKLTDPWWWWRWWRRKRTKGCTKEKIDRSADLSFVVCSL